MTGDEPQPVDLRLLPAAVSMWVVAWIALVVPPWVSAAAVPVAGVVCLRWRRSPVIWVTALLCSVVVVSVLVRLALLHQDPVATLAEQGRTVVLSGTLTSDPQWSERTGFGGGRQVRVVLRAQGIQSSDGSWDVRVPVLVIGEGDGWAPARLGGSVEVRGVLHPESGTRPIAAVLFARGPPALLHDPSWLLDGAEGMRAGLRESVSESATDVRGLLPALVLGDTSHLSPQLVDDLRASGLAHLTAVSGANVAIILVATLLVARLVGVRGYAVPVVGLVTVAWFIILARPDPSVLRAALMGGLGVAAVVAAGHRQGPRLLLASVLLLLLIDPWLARSWGFALSVAATGGLLAVASRLSRTWFVRWPRPLADGVAVALAAQVATLPLTVALSGQVAVFSILANVLAAPAVPPATILGAGAAAVSPVAPGVADVLAWLGQWPTAWIAAVAHRTATAPLATLAWPSGWGGALLAIVIIALLLLGLTTARRRRPLTRRNRWIGLAVAALTIAVYLNGPGRWPPAGWLLVACDVGQGDALVVAAGEHSAIVVDAGPDPAPVDRCLDRLGVRSVPLLVLTHDHADHVAGLPGVLDGRSVGAVLVSPLLEPDEQAAAVALWTDGLPTVVAQPGQAGVINGVSWVVLWPQRIIRGQGSDPNNASVVLMIEVQGTRILLTGDIEPAAQRALALARDDLAADVIKVPHHGSANQDPLFWAEVQPRLAVVSVGEDNTYGHPDPGLLDALTAAGVAVARTDEYGTVALVEDDGLRIVTRKR